MTGYIRIRCKIRLVTLCQLLLFTNPRRRRRSDFWQKEDLMTLLIDQGVVCFIYMNESLFYAVIFQNRISKSSSFSK